MADLEACLPAEPLPEEDWELEGDSLFDEGPADMHRKSCTMGNLDIDFQKLTSRKHSTSTPFIARTLASSGVFGSLSSGPVVSLPLQNECTISSCGYFDREAILAKKLSYKNGSKHVSTKRPLDKLASQTTAQHDLEDLRESLFGEMDCDSKSVDSAMDDSQADSAYEGSQVVSDPDTMTLPSTKSNIDISEDTDSAFGDVISSDISHTTFSDCSSVLSEAPLIESVAMRDISNREVACLPHQCYPPHCLTPPPFLTSCSSRACISPILSASPTPCMTVQQAPDEVMQSILERFSPRESDRLIGRKMGLDHVDILVELQMRKIYWLHSLLQMLSPADLSRMCLVSKQWEAIVEADGAAVQRKRHYLQECEQKKQKENFGRHHSHKVGRLLTSSKEPLAAVQSMCSPPAKQEEACVTSTPVTCRFWKEASLLRSDEKLVKCARCQQPAKAHSVQERAWCSSPICKYDFCIKCHSPFHGAKPCHSTNVKKSKTDVAVGTKRSKQRLRRL